MRVALALLAAALLLTAAVAEITFNPSSARVEVGGYQVVNVTATGCITSLAQAPGDGTQAPVTPLTDTSCAGWSVDVSIFNGPGSLLGRPVMLDENGMGTFTITSDEVGTSGIDATDLYPSLRAKKTPETGREAAAPKPKLPPAVKDNYPCTVTWVGWSVTLDVIPTSVAAGSSVTRAATVKDSNGSPLADRTVTFFQGDENTNIGTSNTNSSGVATLTTTATGSLGSQFTVTASTSITSEASGEPILFNSNPATYTISSVPAWSLVVGNPVPSTVRIPGTIRFTANLTEAPPPPVTAAGGAPARAAGDPVQGQRVNFYLDDPSGPPAFACFDRTDEKGVATCDRIFTFSGKFGVFAQVQQFDGSTLSAPAAVGVDVINDVVIALSTNKTQPQVANTAQRVTATVTQGFVSTGALVFFSPTNLPGLEVVGVSCNPQTPTREQAADQPAKTNFIDQCNVPTRQQGPVPAEPFIEAQVLLDGTAWIELARSTGGNTSVSIGYTAITSLTITGAPVSLAWSPIPAKVLIGPKKAHKRCYEDAHVVARVLDAGGAPVPDQLVTFGVTGSCVPRLESRVVTTDANGYAHLSLTSSEPGVAVVVAATVGANGNAVLSRPSHIVFEEEHHYDEDKAAAHTHGARDSEEEEAHRQYAADAARLALAEVERLMSSKTA